MVQSKYSMLHETSDTDLIVHDLSADIASGRSPAVHELFHSHGLAAPNVIWEPQEADVHNPVLSSFLQVSRRSCDAFAHCSRALFEMEDLFGIQDNLVAITNRGNGDAFVFEFVGADVALALGRDVIGWNVNQLDAPVNVFLPALFRAVLVHRAPVFTVHDPPAPHLTQSWRMLTVPLVEASGEIERIMIAAVPESELTIGLDSLPDPVVVVRDDGTVLHANPTALRTFGRIGKGVRSRDFAEYCSVGLDIMHLFSTAPTSEKVSVKRTASVLDTMIVHFEVTATPILYRKERFVVVTFRPG